MHLNLSLTIFVIGFLLGSIALMASMFCGPMCVVAGTANYAVSMAALCFGEV